MYLDELHPDLVSPEWVECPLNPRLQSRDLLSGTVLRHLWIVPEGRGKGWTKHYKILGGCRDP